MATLSTSLKAGASTAILLPGNPQHRQISAEKLLSDVFSFQQKLAELGISPQSAVSIALPNSYEFIVSFLATTQQRAIAAPLNPAYKQNEFSFYIDDLSSALLLAPRGSVARNVPAVQAARQHNAAVAEVWFDGAVRFEVKYHEKLFEKGRQSVEDAKTDDIALVLHTSGTTGRPKAVSHCPAPLTQHVGAYLVDKVPLTHRNLIRTMRTQSSVE